MDAVQHQVKIILPDVNQLLSWHSPELHDLLREFPEFEVSLTREDAEPAAKHISVDGDAWLSADLDLREFDRVVIERVSQNGPLHISVKPTNAISTVSQILTRYQRVFPRRNEYSSTSIFDTMLDVHRNCYNLDTPLVAADYAHGLDVWQWVLKLNPRASFSLQVAALFHDIERLSNEPDVRIEQHVTDYETFKINHARVSASMAHDILKQIGVAQEVCNEVAVLIASHEKGDSRDPDLVTLTDADALSFFGLSSPGFADYYGAAHTRKKVSHTLSRMSQAALDRLPKLRLRPDISSMLADLRAKA